jgi:hypothetical protein
VREKVLVVKTSGLARVWEAAAFLAMGRTGVYALMNSGRLKFIKIPSDGVSGEWGRRLLWEDLHAFVNERCQAAERDD